MRLVINRHIIKINMGIIVSLFCSIIIFFFVSADNCDVDEVWIEVDEGLIVEYRFYNLVSDDALGAKVKVEKKQ